MQEMQETSSPTADLWSISEMSRRYEVSPRALRFYEDRGLLRPRRQGTVRLYDASSRMTLELVLKGKRLGFTLSEIQDLLSGRTDRMLASPAAAAESDLTDGLDDHEIAAQIAHLERQRGALDTAIGELRSALMRTLPEEACRPAAKG